MGTSVGHLISLSLAFLIRRMGIYWFEVLVAGSSGMLNQRWYRWRIRFKLASREVWRRWSELLQWLPTGAQILSFPPTLRILALSSCLLPHGLNMVAPAPASGLCSGQKEEQGILCPEGEPVSG